MDDITAVAVRPGSVAVPFAGDSLSEAIRDRVREAIIQIANEELTAFLGAGTYARTQSRRGYRNGSKSRSISTSLGRTDFPMPRAVVFEGDHRREWQSAMMPRYSRRAREVDAALLGLYFGGVNTRKVKQAIRPLLRNSPLSKSSISRLVVRLKDYFEAWRSRSLAGEDIRYVYLDGTYVRVRCAGRSGSLPVMVAVGVRASGEKVLLSLRVMGSESAAAWEAFAGDLADRGLKRPELAIIDGNQGLALALGRLWPGLPLQRCVVHKLWNLLAHAPKRLHDEIRADYHAIIYAEEPAAARAAYEGFLRKWRKQHEGVARSLTEAGAELLTFLSFPQAQWKALRTTNIIERLNQEFRRRVKTQGMFPTESSILILLFGLVASGMVRMRRIPGYEAFAGRTQATEPRGPHALVAV
jgi:transposase-like protein